MRNFSVLKQNTDASNDLGVIIDSLTRQQQQAAGSFVSPTLAKSVMAMESLTHTQELELNNAMQGLSTAMESMFGIIGGAKKYTASQREAAKIGAVAFSDMGTFIRTKPNSLEGLALEGATIISNPPSIIGGDASYERLRPALEAYDETENRQAAVYSIAYNLQAARQDETGEAFFPTIVVAPDQVGFAISIRIVTVMPELRRSISGAVNDMKKRNLIDAVIDPTILRNDQTDIVPVFRDESKQFFMDENVVPPWTQMLDGMEVTTSSIKMGAEFSLLGISQTDALLATGIMDNSDSIDSAAYLKTLTLVITDTVSGNKVVEAVKFNVRTLQYANFVAAPQGNYRLLQLNFATDALKLDAKTKLLDGSDSILLTKITNGNFTVRLAVQVSGSINQEIGTTSVFANGLRVSKVYKDGVELGASDADFQAIVALVEKMEIGGCELEARRTNSNRRQRGQLLDSTWNNQIYPVPLRSPISIPRTVTSGDQNDTSDLAALIQTTHIRASQAAITEIFRVAQGLEDYTYSSEPTGDTPAMMGIARYLVKPFYVRETFDLTKSVDSLDSTRRGEDIQSAFYNKIRDLAYRGYRVSGYKAASDAMAGGVGPIPQVILTTDPETARWINVTGDLRTLGGGFDLKLCVSMDQRVAGKMIFTFGMFNGQEGVPNPLHFGNMAWKPETTLVLPMPRNGGISKELTVQPSFIHINHLPILMILDVVGLADVTSNKVTVNVSK